MPFYLLAAFFVGLSVLLFWIGNTYNAITSITTFQKQNKNPLLSRQLRAVLLIMGEHWGTRWIRAMGKLLILVSIMAIGAAFYVAVFKPEQIFSS